MGSVDLDTVIATGKVLVIVIQAVAEIASALA